MSAAIDDDHMDQIFKSLADPTRRDILRRLSEQELSVTDVAEPYDLGYAAISKHLKVLEKADLITRRREGKQFMIKTNPDPLEKVDQWIQYYRNLWNDSLDRLEFLVKAMKPQVDQDNQASQRSQPPQPKENTNND